MLLSNLGKENAVCGDFLGLSKAFYSVDRKTLLMKLEYFGVWGNMNLLIRLFLDDLTVP